VKQQWSPTRTTCGLLCCQAIRVTWRQAVQIVGWLIVAACGWILVSSLVGITWPFATVAGQAFAPIALLVAWPVLLAAAVRRAWALATAAALVCIAHVAFVAPLVRQDPRPAWAATAPTLTIASANVLFENARPTAGAAALAKVDADVIVLVELTPVWVEAMRLAGLLDRYPFHEMTPVKGAATGSGIFSKFPFVAEHVDQAQARLVHSVEVVVGNQTVQIVELHPQAPSSGPMLDSWEKQIEGHAPIVDKRAGPMVLVGDLNASYLHPPFRELLSHGLRDSHELAGEGLTFSYPLGSSVPPVTRIDHALITNEIAVLSVNEMTIPGSDHRGFVTRLAVQQRP
jgi:endonuclease/exonuclease/phosphatase (EEP) superfamily protein YafD